ncbi:hypothetical protein C1646_760320 [Rhizophagus diaphanus]|nr:hypothetical protein C1646_760320 [Rhizophagus diaphanus] [Rhizophagus sp. MUCL 43196]
MVVIGHKSYLGIRNDILSLFINENIEYTHLYISQNFDYNFIPGAEVCFSRIEFLKFNNRGNDKFLSILKKVCKSIKELKLNIYGPDYNDGIVKLVNISFLDIDKSSCKIIVNSLIKYANIIQYIKVWEKTYRNSYYNSDNDTNTTVYNGILIRAIYHNCPNIMYLELLYKNENILDLEILLISC